MHAGCVCGACVCSIDQVSVADVEMAGQDKLNDAIAPHASVSFLALFLGHLRLFSVSH